ncbi:MAG TPA: choice-of-anchor Q domain-containing protein, partial [Solirubrobacter sp.]
QSPGLDTDLRNYGGQTDVLPFTTPSPADNIGGTCPPLDQTGFARSALCDAGAWEYRVNTKITISDPPSGPTSSQSAVFSFDSDAGPNYECRLIRPTAPNPAFSGCDSGIGYSNLTEGAYRFEVRPAGATDLSQGDFATFTVDLTAPDTTIASPGATETIGSDPTFTFVSSEPNARFECSLDQGAVEYTGCESPRTYHDLRDGDTLTFRVRAIDAADNADASPATRTFTVGAAVPTPTPTPTAVPTTSPTPEPTATPVPTPSPTPTATPTPPPVANTSVEVQAESGTVLVKPKGAKTFVALRDGVFLNGAEVDTRHGVVVITTANGEKATFYDGLFTLSQTGGITTLTLSEKLTGCPKAKRSSASAAAKKPKTRKLWGDGKGKFRTKGQYSAATIRGTKWLVTDTCTSTITRVAEGVVSVRDEVKKKTIPLRKGKSYTARAKK